VKAQFERRPVLVLFVGVVAGITAVAHPLNGLLSVLLLAWLPSLRSRLLIALGLVFGVLLPTPGQSHPSDSLPTDSRWIVLNLPKETIGGWSFQAQAVADGRTTTVVTPHEFLPEEGSIVALDGSLRAPREAGESGLLVATQVIEVQPPPLWDRAAARWRESLHLFLNQALDADTSRLVTALCFGGADTLTPNDLTSAKQEGWVTIVTSSGLPVLALIALMEAGASLIPAPRLFWLVALTLIFGLYAFAAGLQSSALRAVVVALILRWGYVFSREPDLLSAVSVAGLLILVVRPSEVYALGFALSMLTLSAIALFTPGRGPRPANLRRRMAANVYAGIRAVTISAIVAIPLIAQRLHHVAFNSVLASFVVVAVVPIIVALAFSGQAMALVAPSVGIGWVALLVGPLSAGLREFFALTAGLSTDVPSFSGYWLLPYFGAWLMLRGRFVKEE